MPRWSRASEQAALLLVPAAKANMPRSQLTASGPCRPSARSITAVSPLDWNCCPSPPAPPQVTIVVDLAVEGDDVPGDRIEHRLHAGRRQVEDREPAVRQQRAPAAVVGRRGPDAVGIGAAMEHGIVHPLQRRAVGRVEPSDDSGYATHQIRYLAGITCHEASARIAQPMLADRSHNI